MIAKSPLKERPGLTNSFKNPGAEFSSYREIFARMTVSKSVYFIKPSKFALQIRNGKYML